MLTLYSKKSIFILLIIYCLSCTSKSMPQSTQLSVASYNLHYFADGYKGIHTTVKALNADVIAFQEVLYKNNHDYSKQLAHDLGYYHAASLPYQHMSKKASWVLAFISKYPIIQSSETRLGNYRKAFKVAINIQGKNVALTTTHLSPFVWTKSNLLAANLTRSRMRQRELKELLQWIGKPDGYALVLGDFNSIPLMGELSVMETYGYKDVYDDLGIKNHGTFPLNAFIYKKASTYMPIPKVITFDYIFISSDCKADSASVYESKASDHYPVVAKISLMPAKVKK